MRHIGVCNFDGDQLRQIQQVAPVETLQPQYSLIERDIPFLYVTTGVEPA